MIATPVIAPILRDEVLRIEALEREQGLAIVEALRQLFPTRSSGREPTRLLEIAGGIAICGSPRSEQDCLRGLDPWHALSSEELESIEDFYSSGGFPSTVLTAQIDDGVLVRQLVERGYSIRQSFVVMSRSLAGGPLPEAETLPCRRAEPEERELWARLSMQGFLERPAPILHAWFLGRPAFASADECFFATAGDEPVATAALFCHQGLALLSDDSTLPSFRCRGAQQSLIAKRLGHARELGCRSAVARVEPSSTSYRNYRQHGFEALYTAVQLSRLGRFERRVSS